MPAPSLQTPTSIVLVDDTRLVRRSLELLLDGQDDMSVVAQATDAEGALRAVLGYKPDVLVLDPAMNDGGACMAALLRVRERSPSTATVVLTSDERPMFARRSMRAGALSFVLKSATDVELIGAVRLAARGWPYINPALGALLATMPEAGGLPDDLSERECQVLRLIALGFTNADIGAQLFLSVRTVESHRAHVQRKLGHTKRPELVRYALDHGMMHAEPTSSAVARRSPDPPRAPDPASGPPLTGDAMLSAVNGELVALHRRYHERAPVSATTRLIDDELLACVMGGVDTEVETTMIELQRSQPAQDVRSAFQLATRNKFIEAVERLSGREVLVFTTNSHVGPEIEVELFQLAPAQKAAA